MASVSEGTKPHISPKAKAQQWWIFAHRWMGIILLIPMALLGLTGSALVWPAVTESLVAPEHSVSADADPAKIELHHITAGREALAEYGPITAARIGGVGSPLIWGSAPVGPPNMGLGPPTRMAAYVDPVSGDLLATERSTGNFMWYMHAIHGHLLISGIGRPVVGVMGIFLLLSAITGLVIWWPGRRKIIAALKWRKWEGKMLNIHRQSGVILSLVLIAEAFTGVWVSFPGFFAQIVEPGVEQTGRRGPGGPRGGPQSPPIAFTDANWADAIERGSAAFSGRLTGVQAPSVTDGDWELSFSSEAGRTSVKVPNAGGEVIVEANNQTPSRASSTRRTMDGIHAGHIGGPIWQWLAFLSGLFLAFFSISGVYVWGKRQLKRGRPAK